MKGGLLAICLLACGLSLATGRGAGSTPEQQQLLALKPAMHNEPPFTRPSSPSQLKRATRSIRAQPTQSAMP